MYWISMVFAECEPSNDFDANKLYVMPENISVKNIQIDKVDTLYKCPAVESNDLTLEENGVEFVKGILNREHSIRRFFPSFSKPIDNPILDLEVANFDYLENTETQYSEAHLKWP
eukprot:NODE_1245_length_1627_cov_0.988874.p2 type:complete len:115 gc:universal NODE_1245_length_1627_cov_0.988874:425-81(-)